MTPEASYILGAACLPRAWLDASWAVATVLAVSVHLGDDNESDPDRHERDRYPAACRHCPARALAKNFGGRRLVPRRSRNSRSTKDLVVLPLRSAWLAGLCGFEGRFGNVGGVGFASRRVPVVELAAELIPSQGKRAGMYLRLVRVEAEAGAVGDCVCRAC
jgi:hypothetical protein